MNSEKYKKIFIESLRIEGSSFNKSKDILKKYQIKFSKK